MIQIISDSRTLSCKSVEQQQAVKSMLEHSCWCKRTLMLKTCCGSILADISCCCKTSCSDMTFSFDTVNGKGIQYHVYDSNTKFPPT